MLSEVSSVVWQQLKQSQGQKARGNRKVEARRRPRDKGKY